jgi:hypothetical protein
MEMSEGCSESQCRRELQTVVPPKASKDDKLPKIKRWDMEGPPVRYIQTGGA